MHASSTHHPLLRYGALVPLVDPMPVVLGPPPRATPAFPASLGLLTRVRPAGQAAATTTAPPGTCAVCPHCATLPSAQSAHAALSGGGLGSWLRVGRDMLLRGVLIWTGIVAYDAVAGHRNPWRLQYAVAGAAGIEVFVLLWTALTTPRAAPTAAT